MRARASGQIGGATIDGVESITMVDASGNTGTNITATGSSTVGDVILNNGTVTLQSISPVASSVIAVSSATDGSSNN